MNSPRTIMVTGASSGIGRATVERLLEHGYRVIGLARDFSKFECDAVDFIAVSVDLSVLDELPVRLEAIISDHGPVDAVVCCAGTGRFGSLEEFSFRQIGKLIDLNLTSQIYVVRALLPAMKRRGAGGIILMGSEAARSGGKRGAVYSAAKFGLRGLAQSLRQECASSGVRIGIINPGMVKTEFFDALDFAPGEEECNYILPGDVARAVLEMLESRPGTVIDEINLSPQKKIIRPTPPKGDPA
jgi:NADP-dependent 3-hydroxy acid dehydrogenase YdfG